jgi:hypothetical protein
MMQYPRYPRYSRTRSSGVACGGGRMMQYSRYPRYPKSRSSGSSRSGDTDKRVGEVEWRRLGVEE